MKFLNTRLFILLVLLGGIMTSCSKDSDDVGPALTGKWIIKTGSYKSYINNVIDEEETENFSGVAYFDFKTDGTLLVKNEDGDVEELEYTYDASAQEISIIDSDGETILMKIQELTSSTLIIYSEESETDAGTTYKYRASFTCSRA